MAGKATEMFRLVSWKCCFNPVGEDGRLFAEVGRFQSVSLLNWTVGRSDGEGRPEKGADWALITIYDPAFDGQNQWQERKD